MGKERSGSKVGGNQGVANTYTVVVVTQVDGGKREERRGKREEGRGKREIHEGYMNGKVSRGVDWT